MTSITPEITISNSELNNSKILSTDNEYNDHYKPSVRELIIPKNDNGSCGFHLSRSKWDPYPWISGVDKSSPAENVGVKIGDCVLEVNGEDILGLRVADVANIVKSKPENVTVLLWTTGMEPICDSDTICCGPMPLNLERLSSSVQAILSAIECPICMDTIPPPAIQCLNGHLICLKCRIRAERCPMCRERYCPGRSLLAEHVYNSITESFKLNVDNGKLRERLFGAKCQKTNSTVETGKVQNSPKNKLLARIMGKATSMDSLNFTKKDGRPNEMTNMLQSKHISLSVNELTRIGNQSEHNHRSSSTQQLTSENEFHLSADKRKPRSRTVSIECLSSDTTDLFVMPNTENEYCCPGDEDCNDKIKRSLLNKHILQLHKTPIVLVANSTAKFELPLITIIENACFILQLDNKQFWLKILKNQDNYFISSLMEDTILESSKYFLTVKIKNIEHELLSTEILRRAAIFSLMQKSRKDVTLAKEGVTFTQQSLITTFETIQSLILVVSIERISEI